jgi:EAL domain-containing protein (putative c-di-GMP-specific phosphodiesterase class I)
VDRVFIARAELTSEDLAALGCRLGQGYHLCRPADAEDLPAFLESATRSHPNASLTA